MKAWSFQSPRGYRVTGFYSLPVNFDLSKKYPVIVHYYGGCSPTSRRYGNGSHYPSFYWNALGYIVFNVNPSGASGYGQEWASRHVNTMGEGPAQDIIDATWQFVKDVPQCDADHIGCVSASYGGFMTQYMMTKDNHPFACGVSHAGISSHTSYWGEGYWGYSYSEGKKLKKVMTACGIEKAISYHCGRHSFATLALSKGMPIESVSRVLGHTNIVTTQIYAKITSQNELNPKSWTQPTRI